MFKGRSANTPEDLEKGNWVVLAKIPDATPKVSIADIFKAKNAPMGKLFELEVTLKGIIKADTIVSPKVKSFGVTYQCTPIAN